VRAARRAPTASTTVTVPSSRKSRAASRVAARIIGSLPARPSRHHLSTGVWSRRHLEKIYAKLGVRTRTAAASRLLGALEDEGRQRPTPA
jgi:hypothetical protein